jgi:hypothetical protein
MEELGATGNGDDDHENSHGDSRSVPKPAPWVPTFASLKGWHPSGLKGELR